MNTVLFVETRVYELKICVSYRQRGERSTREQNEHFVRAFISTNRPKLVNYKKKLTDIA